MVTPKTPPGGRVDMFGATPVRHAASSAKSTLSVDNSSGADFDAVFTARMCHDRGRCRRCREGEPIIVRLVPMVREALERMV